MLLDNLIATKVSPLSETFVSFETPVQSASPRAAAPGLYVHYAVRPVSETRSLFRGVLAAPALETTAHTQTGAAAVFCLHMPCIPQTRASYRPCDLYHFLPIYLQYLFKQILKLHPSFQKGIYQQLFCQ